VKHSVVIEEHNLIKLMKDLSFSNGPFGFHSTERITYRFVDEKEDGTRWFSVDLNRGQMKLLNYVLNGFPATRRTLEQEYDTR
jgi:hypothetical protein